MGVVETVKKAPHHREQARTGAEHVPLAAQQDTRLLRNVDVRPVRKETATEKVS